MNFIGKPLETMIDPALMILLQKRGIVYLHKDAEFDGWIVSDNPQPDDPMSPETIVIRATTSHHADRGTGISDLTDEEIAELHRADRNSLPAPWVVDSDDGDWTGKFRTMNAAAAVTATDILTRNTPADDATIAVLVAARNALPSLLEEVERRRARERAAAEGWPLGPCPRCGEIDVVRIEQDTDAPMQQATGLFFEQGEGRVLLKVTVVVEHATGKKCSGTVPPGWVMP